MKIHAFRVGLTEESAPIESVLQAIRDEDSLRQRIRLVGQSEMRAEAVEHRDGVWLMDFVKIRTAHGPGRVGRDTEVEGFEFEAEEGFGEETGALYDPVGGHMLIQYNHFGVRHGAVSDYLSAYDENGSNLYTLKPKFDEDVERRLLSQGITRRVKFQIDVSRMTAQDRARGAALSQAIDYGRQSGADKVEVSISVQGERNRSLADTARAAVNSLLSLAGQNPEAVTKLEVSGKEDEDSIVEVLDLLGHRLSVEVGDLRLGADLRYPRDERWRALERALNGWQRVLR
jgi:hypothetical protein